MRKFPNSSSSINLMRLKRKMRKNRSQQSLKTVFNKEDSAIFGLTSMKQFESKFNQFKKKNVPIEGSSVRIIEPYKLIDMENKSKSKKAKFKRSDSATTFKIQKYTESSKLRKFLSRPEDLDRYGISKKGLMECSTEEIQMDYIKDCLQRKFLAELNDFVKLEKKRKRAKDERDMDFKEYKEGMKDYDVFHWLNVSTK